MKATFLILIFFVCGIARGQGKVTIAFNMDECSNCYNNLRNLDVLKPGTPIAFVFKSQYRKDSADIVRNLYLDRYHATFTWSDTLCQALLYDKLYSGVSIENTDLSKRRQFSLKNHFNAAVAAYCNRLTAPTDTLLLQDAVFSSGVRSVQYRDQYMYVSDGFKNRITCVSLVSGATDKVINMSDTLGKAAFLLKFKDTTTWGVTQALVRRYRVANPMKFKDFFVGQDRSISALAEYAYFLVTNGNKDTAKIALFALHQFDAQGSLIKTQLIDQIVDETSAYAKRFFNSEIQDTILYYYVTSSLFKSGDRISLDMTHFPAKGFKPKRKYFRGDFTLQADGHYRFNKFYDKDLPSVYQDYGNNFTNILYSGDGAHFALPLTDVIYSIDSPGHEIHLNVFNGAQFEGLPYAFNYMMNQVHVGPKYAYACYWLSKAKENRLLQYDLATAKTVRNNAIDARQIPEEYLRLLRIDDFDQHYMLVPIAPDKLLRFRALEGQ